MDEVDDDGDYDGMIVSAPEIIDVLPPCVTIGGLSPFLEFTRLASISVGCVAWDRWHGFRR